MSVFKLNDNHVTVAYLLHCSTLPDKRCLSHACAFIGARRRCTFWMTSLITLNQHENYVIFSSLKGETTGKLINRIPGSRLLISRLLEHLLNRQASLASLAMSTSVLKALPGKLDIKRLEPGILYSLMVCCWKLVFDWAHWNQRLVVYNKHVSLWAKSHYLGSIRVSIFDWIVSL